MKLNEIKCTNCGAKLSVEEGQEKVVCNFCKTEFAVEDAYSEGYSYEKGKLKAQEEHIRNMQNQMFNNPIFKESKKAGIIIAIVALVIMVSIIISAFSQTRGINVSSHNSYYEQFEGTEMGSSVTSVLDNVVTNNKTKKNKIVIKFNDKTAKTEQELKKIKEQIESFSDYDLSMKYDKKGLINQITITEIKKDISASSFNFFIKDIQGENMGFDWRITSYVIPSNKKNPNHIITIVYNGTEATTEDDILAISKKMDEFKHYYYSVDYDEKGYVNKITIKE